MTKYFYQFVFIILFLCYQLFAQGVTILNNLPAKSWYQVPNSNMRQVCPDMPEEIFQGACDCSCVIDAWGGGTYDPNRQMFLIWGGGHNDYYGNELYAFHLETLSWELLTQPSQPAPPGQCLEVLSDGRPNSRHTYGGIAFIAHADRLFAHGGSLACYNGNGSNKTWTFDSDGKKWYDMNPRGNAPSWDLLDEYSVYDPFSKKVFLFWHSRLYSYDYDNNIWTNLDNQEISWPALSCTIDTKRGLLVEVGNGDVGVRNIKSGSYRRQSWSTAGGNAIVNAYAPGLAYDPVADRVIGWNGAEIYSLDMDNKTWEVLNVPGAPKKSNNGIFGRFAYLPGYNAFIAVTDVDENVYFYKNTSGSSDWDLLPDTLRVGSGREYKMPSQAAMVAEDNDVIEIDAGLYSGDVAVWTQNNLTIRGVGGYAHLEANGRHAVGKGIWVIQGNNTTIENIEFSGAKVPDRNGAGIRQEGSNLTVRHCYFHDNENGILGPNDGGEILIEYSEFSNNGYGDGYTHNMYILDADEFVLRYNYIHHAKIGHNVKTRAKENYILYNRIMDEQSGTSSYIIDIPDGGSSYIIGNLIQQGPFNDNSTIISYGAESLSYPWKDLYVVNNTIVNDSDSGTFIYVAPGSQPVEIINNLFVGVGNPQVGPGNQITNIQSNNPGLKSRATFDYHLDENSPAINAGTDPGTVDGFNLTPESQYKHPANSETRDLSGNIDIGAYEYKDFSTHIDDSVNPERFQLLSAFPNPFNLSTTIQYTILDRSAITLNIYDVTGKLVRSLISNQVKEPGEYTVKFDAKQLGSGQYIVLLDRGNNASVKYKIMLIK